MYSIPKPTFAPSWMVLTALKAKRNSPHFHFLKETMFIKEGHLINKCITLLNLHTPDVNKKTINNVKYKYRQPSPSARGEIAQKPVLIEGLLFSIFWSLPSVDALGNLRQSSSECSQLPKMNSVKWQVAELWLGAVLGINLRWSLSSQVPSWAWNVLQGVLTAKQRWCQILVSEITRVEWLMTYY